MICFSVFFINGLYAGEPEIWQDIDNDEQGEPEEPEGWVFAGEFSKVFSQAGFSNWAAGGENSFSSTSIIRLDANYQKDNISFENNLDLRYGLYKTESRSLRKNEDKIDFTFKLGRKIREKLNSSAMVNYRTQFTAGYHYPNDTIAVSRGMAPGFLTASLGFDYIPWEFLSVFASPVSGRFTFVLDEELAGKGAFGVDTGKSVNADLGSIIVLTFNKRFTDNVRVRSKLEVFNAYIGPDTYSWKNSVINWESMLRVSITEYFTANLLLHIIYDHNISVPVYETIDGEEIITGEEQWQIKQTFGLGFSYTF